MAREIFVENYESGALTAATSVVLADQGGAYGIREKVSQDVEVAADTAASNPSTGVYTYDIDDLDANTVYEYVFKITRTSGDIEYVAGEIAVLPSEDASESTLSLEYNDLMNLVAYFLHGKSSADCNAAQRAVIDTAVQNGYRQFLYPPTVEGIPPGYEWTFMRPVTTITTTEDDADQDMPGDFGRLIGDGFTWASDAQQPVILADVGEGRIRKLRAAMAETGKPRVAGLRRKAGTGGTGQRWEVLWHPIPDDEYVYEYRYEALTDALSSELPFPLGGMKHAATLRASCLAAADELVNDGAEQKMNDFILVLASSISRDKKEQKKFYGAVGCHGEYDQGGALRGDSNYTLSVGGEQLYP